MHEVGSEAYLVDTLMVVSPSIASDGMVIDNGLNVVAASATFSAVPKSYSSLTNDLCQFQCRG